MTCRVCSSSTFGNNKGYCSEQCRKYRLPFRVWDGEGFTDPTTGEHRFSLLACTDGKDREYIEDANGLSTAACLSFLTKQRAKAINVWFAFGYDVNMMLKDLPLERKRFSRYELWTKGQTRWYTFRIEYIKRKMLTVVRTTKQFKYVFQSFDVFGFFQTSFIKACADWGIDTSSIQEGKEQRANFIDWSPERIREYNFREMDLFLELCNKLRDALYAANLLPQSWHGPGAIASLWLTQRKMKQFYSAFPYAMQEPIMHGYFGGRIDVSTLGELNVYKNDIASAYPAGLRDCIALNNIQWKHSKKARRSDKHALYHVSWMVPRTTIWGPLPWRNHRGVVLYPWEGEGWYWGVELLAAERLFPGKIHRLEAWFPSGPKEYPLHEPLTKDYEYRAVLKKIKNAAHVSIKLALNSLYGKLAQHEARRHGKPPWQNYIWAGYTTATTRAAILDAIRVVGPTNVVAVSTDGIMTRVPLPGAEENNTLGTWQDEGYVSALIVAPGLYATFSEDKTDVYRARGMPSSLNYGFILRSWGCVTQLNTKGDDSNTSRHSNFIGMGRALHTSLPCNRFIEEERTLSNIALVGTSKRMPCPFQTIEHKPWKEFNLVAKPRQEHVISYPYKYRMEFNAPEEE